MTGMSAYISKRVSIVFNLIDDYYRIPVLKAKISADGLKEPSINKNDGNFVFINLEKRKYVFRIEAFNYLSVEKEVDLSACEGSIPFINIYMKHAANSNKISGGALFGKLQSFDGHAFSRTSFKISIISENSNFKLLDKVLAGSRAIRIFAAMKDKLEGQMLLLREKGKQDYYTIENYKPMESTYLLENELTKALKAGTILYPAWELSTDEKGEFLLPLRPVYYEKDDTIKLLVDMGNKTAEIEVGYIREHSIKATFNID